MFHNYFLRCFNKIYLKNSSLTCFDTTTYTYDSKGRIKGTGVSVSGPISIASVSVSTYSKLIKIKSYIKR